MSEHRSINAAGLALVKEFEGLRLVAYDDLAPNRKLKKGDRIQGTLTIGHGHTGPDVFIGQKITPAEAEALLREDLREAESGVLASLARAATDNEFSAMVSLAFNIGWPRFRQSSVCRHFNAGETTKAADSFGLWNKAGGKVLQGLVRRRAAEAALFLTAAEEPPAHRATQTPDDVKAKPKHEEKDVIGIVSSIGVAVGPALAGIDWKVVAVLAAAGLVGAFIFWKRGRK